MAATGAPIEGTKAEVRSTAQRLAEARVRRFAKIVEVAGAHLDLAPTDIVQLAQTLRGDPDSRGPIAFVVAANRGAFARQFAAATAHEAPVNVFHSLHEVRAWDRSDSAGRLPSSDQSPDYPSRGKRNASQVRSGSPRNDDTRDAAA
jgi:hypothetical protein